MNYVNLRRTVLIAVSAMAAAELSSGMINPFVLDLFQNCFDGTADPTSFTCEYARPLMTHLIGGLIFFASIFILGVKTSRIIRPVSAAFMALAYTVIQMASFRFTIALSDNFIGLRDPETFTEYLFATYVSVNSLLVGLIIAAFYWIGSNINRFAVDASKRNEPRQVYGKKNVKSPPAKKVSTTKKATSKKTTVKKTSRKK